MSKFDNEAVWRFYMDNYFPFLYCLMYLEQKFREKGMSQDYITEKKREFVKFGKAYFEKNKLDYEEEYVDELIDVVVSKEFLAVLLYRYNMYRENTVVIDFVAKAVEMVETAVT